MTSVTRHPQPPADGRAVQLSAYLRAANYLAAAQIYLRDNCLLEEPLVARHVKPRLLGHWGTCPGINLVHATLNRLILAREARVILVTGPGHGAAANLANLWLEGSLEAVDPALSRDRAGLQRLVRAFSWPGGFPSHLAATVPGVIHEGGELGYALSTAFGAAFDNPDLVVACVVGDGEAETGPTATAWHSSKFLDPVGDGAVLPILHLNRWKISNPTIFGTMDGDELVSLMQGYGWRPWLVSGDLESELTEVVMLCHDEIRGIQEEARTGRAPVRPTWPMVVLDSPKGWTGIRELDGQPIEGTFRAHQVPAKHARENPTHLAALESWLRSYRPEELFDEAGCPVAEVLAACPGPVQRIGTLPEANGGSVRIPLKLPALEPHTISCERRPGASPASALEATGRWLADVVRENGPAANFRIVCPDELESNRLGAVLEATSRVYSWPLPAQASHQAASGRVMEILSEHTCQGWLQGYLLTGRHGLFPSYEAFISIVDGMVNQYAKFLKTAREVPWRKPVSSLNYLLTSEGWRQEHNGYSHQGPGFINTMLDKKSSVVRVYLPPDANTTLVTMEHCLASTGYINVIIASKQPLAQWLSLPQARAHSRAGASRWAFASHGDDSAPDVVLACAGAIPTVETLAAAQLLRKDAPHLAVRVVNVIDLLTLCAPQHHPHGLDASEFERLFTLDRPVVFDFHGYPSAVHQLLHGRPRAERFHVKGYVEEGATTTPFDLLAANGVSRYHLAIEALRRTHGWASTSGPMIEGYQRALTDHRRYIVEHGVDPPDVTGWQWG